MRVEKIRRIAEVFLPKRREHPISGKKRKKENKKAFAELLKEELRKHGCDN